ncbi:NUDIX hydrolase [Sphingomonas immobilis]|uniref:NUDIX domain-containing protein n=1 Tax=Sphingomonas immobilis TaxID=3063997 RepID=A0ABT9A433_9SPHN|nr:NUDIX domain-containing protein [Sphingomonas sp. CA1-15]MDO7843726.1 NUDIX domain-containing protein [Sphingomonas sp. CA1-15]
MTAEIVRVPRPAARILLTDGDGRVLMFRFSPDDRPPFWCTPGGAVDPGESYEAAARRELLEETGIAAEPGPEVARRVVEFLTLEGVPVIAEERYFRVRVAGAEIDTSRHTPLEQRVMQEWRWFAPHEIAGFPEPLFPEDLTEMLSL